jgi:tetratricopeptide (TPR) repeat protein
LGEPEALLFATRSRALMRTDENDASVAEADRALRIAELRNLELVAAMALVNKGSAYAQMGRRYESEGLLGTGIRLANRGGWSHLELRALRNLANTVVDDEPVRALETTLDAIETARRLGDHQAFTSLVVVYADFALPAGAGEHWDRAIDLMAEASELPAAAGERMGIAAVRIDHRIRRGEDVTDALEEVDRLTDEDPDPRSAEIPAMLRAAQAVATGHPDEAVRIARGIMQRDITQSAIAGQALVTGSILTADVDTLRWAETAMEELPFHGAWSHANRQNLTAAREALEGRTADAIADFTRSLDTYARLGARLAWARGVLDALLALPGEPRFLALAPEARTVFEGIDAAPFIALLDDAVTRPPSTPSEAPAETPSGTAAPAS